MSFSLEGLYIPRNSQFENLEAKWEEIFSFQKSGRKRKDEKSRACFTLTRCGGHAQGGRSTEPFGNPEKRSESRAINAQRN